MSVTVVDFRAYENALAKLRLIAHEQRTTPLAAAEARELLDHITWLRQARESLLRIFGSPSD